MTTEQKRAERAREILAARERRGETTKTIRTIADDAADRVRFAMILEG